MDLDYFTQGEELNQDQFSLSRPTFGEQGQLEEVFKGLDGTPRLKKEEYPDGFTETTKEENREEIIKICLESGADRVDLSEIP